jgi:hypothetical protein
MKSLLAALFVLGGLVIGIAPSGVGATNGFRMSGVVQHSGAPVAHTGASLAATTATALGCGAITCAAYQSGINGFLSDVASASGQTTNVYSVATQYGDNAGALPYTQAFGSSYVDTSAFPTSGTCPTGSYSACLTESQLVSEIQKDMTAKGWTASNSKMYFIMLPANVDTCGDAGGAECASNTFCAYHSAAGSLIFAVEPFNATFSCSGADEPTNPQGFPNGQEVDESINTISHEENEAITDPYGNGWYTAQGTENGDMCAWWFGAPLGTATNGQPYNQLINGHDYSLQQEFGNSANLGAGGCLQSVGGTASTASPYVGDAGPLVSHGGSVMHAVTSYTIYWVPGAKPAVITKPKVSGTAKVNNQLSLNAGTWTNTPDSFSFQWLRCSSTGTSCVAIKGATNATYKPVTKDAGHKLEAKVTATNWAGTSKAALSNKTTVVKK